MVESLVAPWREPILREAMLELLFIGVACGALGVWIILYGLAYSAESLAHGMFPGLVAAALVGAPAVLGGAVGLVVAGIAIAVAARLRGVGSDNAVAVVITTLFGVGALLALAPASPPGLQELLFGDVLSSSPTDLLLSGVLAAVVLAGMWAVHWRLLTVGFDPGSARPSVSVHSAPNSLCSSSWRSRCWWACKASATSWSSPRWSRRPSRHAR